MLLLLLLYLLRVSVIGELAPPTPSERTIKWGMAPPYSLSQRARSLLDRPLSRLSAAPSSGVIKKHAQLNSPPRLVASRDRTFSWSRNKVSRFFVVFRNCLLVSRFNTDSN
uniref:Putative secretory peptide-17 n=1 Tax=Pleurobrachia bachei TaxID=34499 RepID=M4H1D1_PLEBA|nr:putative secretory peptide-17 [Pleurobrachia bachei]|eukprot:sb/3477195/